MLKGFWLVQYEGLEGNGGGVAILLDKDIFGGDSGATYTGTYEFNGKEIRALVKVRNYMPGVASVIGVEGDYDLAITGTIEGNVIKAAGRAEGHDVAGLALRLTKLADIPA